MPTDPAAPPPLPATLPVDAPRRRAVPPRASVARAAAAARQLRGGCWLLNVTPAGPAPLSFDGTLRVDRDAAGCTISGDLYQRPILSFGTPPRAALGPPPSAADGIPCFPIARYVQHLRVTALDERSGTGVRLTFEAWQFDPTAGWSNRGLRIADLTFLPAPAAFPSRADYLEGDVVRETGEFAARMRIGWIAPRLRKATVEIDTVAGCERPSDNAAGFGWATLFDRLNWEGRVLLSDSDVREPADGNWSDAALHAAMLERRDRVSLDAEWRYHLLSVRRTLSADRGVMYDNGGSDANAVPREGCALAAHWPIPDTQEWGLVRNQRFGAAAPAFFRAAIHELGHAFGLDHSAADLGFMNTTEVIAQAGTPARPFPTNVAWTFSPNDLRRLRHWPDILVRPGGARIGFGFAGGPPPILADMSVDPNGLTLTAAPLLGETPIGAPVRVAIRLANRAHEPREVPVRISLKTDVVSGRVIDPAGVERRFSSLLGCVEDRTMRPLFPGEATGYDLTLLRGRDGALFPTPGLYRIVVDLTWPVPPARLTLTAETTLFVTGARDPAHAAAAHRILATPDAHLVLVMGGDHLTEGLAAITQALANPVLRPHYAAIEARRVAGLGRRRTKPKLAADTVMSASEAAKLAELTTPARRRTPRPTK